MSSIPVGAERTRGEGVMNWIRRSDSFHNFHKLLNLRAVLGVGV